VFPVVRSRKFASTEARWPVRKLKQYNGYCYKTVIVITILFKIATLAGIGISVLLIVRRLYILIQYNIIL